MSNWLVRRANEQDKDWIVGEVERFLQFMGNVVPFDGPHIVWLIDHLIATQWVVVVERDGERSGVAIAVVQPHFLNPQVRTLTELMWWVPEEKRQGRAGLLLLNAMEQIAAAEKVHLLVLSTETISPLSGRSLAKRGFKQKELSWVKEL